jgi:hypothetical protein
MLPSFRPYNGARVLITEGLGSHLAVRPVDLGAQVTLVDSLIPEYGGLHVCCPRLPTHE